MLGIWAKSLSNALDRGFGFGTPVDRHGFVFDGGFGLNLRRICLMLRAQGQVTTVRLTTLLNVSIVIRPTT
jgi:hypothetical protein